MKVYYDILRCIMISIKVYNKLNNFTHNLGDKY